MTNIRSEQAARLTLEAAYDECRAVNIDPANHQDLLADFATNSVRQAVMEMAVDQKTAGPKFAFQLTTAAVQNIYFADAGRRAAHSLLKHLGVPHARLTTNRKG